MTPSSRAAPRLAGGLSAVASILDLANGLEQDKSLLTGLLAFDLARASGQNEHTTRAAFLAGLLRHLGCTAYAAEESSLAEDDIGLRSRLLRADTTRPGELLGALNGASSGWRDRLSGVARLLTSARSIRAEWTQEACGAARLLAGQLGLGDLVLRALDEVFERWDGRGSPAGIGGEDLSFAGRAATTAHTAVLFGLQGGAPLARELLTMRSGNVLDPTMATRAAAQIGALLGGELEPTVAAVEQLLERDPLPVSAQLIAETFGDFADLQLPFKRGHSRRVADAAMQVAGALGLAAEERASLRMAAHLHDLGQVAIPTGIWLRPAWTSLDRERARLHPLYTERVLSAAPELKDAARIAGGHHERLDGSGYHRGASAMLSRSTQILAAVEAHCSLLEERPHRAAQSEKEASAFLRKEARAGRLDPDIVAALLGGSPSASGRKSSLAGPMAQLTPRELEVLRLLAQGHTNKEIAVELGLSARTVQHHSIHIYGKLGVDTRAAAALLAARHGVI